MSKTKGAGGRKSLPLFSLYQAIRERNRKYNDYREAVERHYQEGLDRLERYEYNLNCSDVNAQVERRLRLFHEYSKSEIRQSVKDTGYTPSELEGILQDEAVEQGTEDRAFLLKHMEGRLQSPDPTQDPEAWYSDRERDLLTNVVYTEYMTQLFTQDESLNFDQFSQWLASVAYWRILTRGRYRKEILETLGGEHPSTEEIENFTDRGFHRGWREYRLEFIQNVYQHLTGSQQAVRRLLELYGEAVREAWDRTRTQGKTPLPGEKDWMFLEADDDPVERAVDMYLTGANINQAAKANNIGSRRLSQELDRLGIERKPRKGRQ